MTQYIDLLQLSVQSTGAVARARAVTFGGAQVTVAGGKTLGIAKFPAAAAGETIAVTVAGTAIVEAGATIAVGDALRADALGRLVPAAALTVATGAVAVTSSAANGAILVGADGPDWVVGDALQAATAAGQFIEVLLRR